MTNRGRSQVLAAIAWMLVGLLAVLMIYTILAIRDTQRANTVKNDRAAETLHIIKDCTTPGGQCYHRSQEQTSRAVGDINRVVVLAAACSVGLDPTLPVQERQARIQTCVINRLAVQEP